jgi:hypothetical protein
MQAVEDACRRPIQIHCRHCAGASTDEQRLIVATGMAPVDPNLGEALLAPLLYDAGAVMTLARALNAALTASGLPLPSRLGGDLVQHEAAKVTLH